MTEEPIPPLADLEISHGTAKLIDQNFKNSFLRTNFFMVTAIACFLASNDVVAATTIHTPPQVGTKFRDCPNCPEITILPAGDFLMGTSIDDAKRLLEQVAPDERKSIFSFMGGKGASDYFEQEEPQHLVHINHPFGLGTYPVTRKEFEFFVKQTGDVPKEDKGCVLYKQHGHPIYPRLPGYGWQSPGFDQTDSDPVVCVNIEDAEAYVTWLNAVVAKNDPLGKNSNVYYLPSEAEWEYAARAGTKTFYWWGDSIGVNNSVCRECGSLWDNKQTAPIGSFRPNAFGLYDMLGNVWEWTADCWNDSYNRAPIDGSAWTSGDCQRRVMRGGAWNGSAWNLTSFSRAYPLLDDRANTAGFRVARRLQ